MGIFRYRSILLQIAQLIPMSFGAGTYGEVLHHIWPMLSCAGFVKMLCRLIVMYIAKGTASKCVCCSNPTIENLEHLLIHSDLAKDFRSYFAEKLHKPVEVQTVHHFITSWLAGFSLRAQCGYNVLGIIIFGLWMLWKHHCKLKFEGAVLAPQAVVRSYFPKRRHTWWEGVILESLRLPIREVVR